MQELITIQIIRPPLETLNASDRKAFIDGMAKDIATQIMRHEDHRHMNEDRRYWEEKLHQWEVEDTLRRFNGN